MRIRLLFIASAALLIQACQKEEGGFTVSGKLEHNRADMIYLKEMTSRDLIPVDSCKMDSSGNFRMRGISPESRFFAVYSRPGDYVYLLAESGDRITLNGDERDLAGSYRVEGSEDSRLIRELTTAQSRSLEKIRELSKIFNDSMESPTFTNIKAGLDSSYQQIVAEQRQFTFRFIEDNLGSQASLMALYQQIGPRYYLLDPSKDFRYFAMVDSSLYSLYPESDAVADLHRQVTELRQQKQMEAMNAAKFGIGQVAPEIALPSPSGDTILLSSLRGKIVLLDFWASWCAPCRSENPNLVANYKKYRDKGFEIYQVSLDRSRAAWLKGIKDDKLDWIHVSDLQYWNSIVVPVYNIQGIPMNFLLDRNGKIIAQNLRGEELGRKLEETFNSGK